ncbi:MAG: endolytic transglycosylase MltG, partial [Terriglobales bacterium]
MPALRRTWLPLLLLLLLAAGLFWLWGPGPRLPAPVVVEIPPGAGHVRIARQLAAAGAVRAAFGFEAWALLHRSRRLEAGAYEFRGGESVPTVFSKLARGQFYAIAVVIPEGYNRFDIARALQAQGLASAPAFLAATADPASIRDLDPAAVSLEGYLFPATYSIAPGTPLARILQMMTERFRQEARRQHVAPEDLHRWLTIASLVEKETAVAAERPLIAGVFANRLADGMPLQCDATVIYAAELEQRYHGGIGRAELKAPSPYNTYTHAGLPPGPIANPGRAALLAAAHPAATDYLYFVSNGAGAHNFARTLAE